ncbi:hypothetical protein FRX31_008308 [Thalictrum thalictroides]|uniref:Uncharacterized protein n=1 Tax=Thalictrum thalictroides TaxID=46969 RepID=A0A7J6WZ40_THATH|nr:hypothetical protein FRX31_008308 [Thalictrum thalictroides]
MPSSQEQLEIKFGLYYWRSSATYIYKWLPQVESLIDDSPEELGCTRYCSGLVVPILSQLMGMGTSSWATEKILAIVLLNAI